MNLPKITHKQQEIIKLLYSYRFLNRVQIQTLLHHKSHKTVTLWLQDLRDKQYIEWIYSTDFEKKSKPAIYYLGINGVRYLRSTGNYPLNEIRKRYYESGRSEGFVSRSIVLGDICIELDGKTSESVRYVSQTASQFALPGSPFHFVQSIKQFHPDVCYCKDTGGTRTLYLVELLDATLPRERVKRRLKRYVDYLDYELENWQKLSGETKRPTVLFVCPTVGELLYCKRRTRRLLRDIPHRGELHLKFETLETIKTKGFLNNQWEEA